VPPPGGFLKDRKPRQIGMCKLDVAVGLAQRGSAIIGEETT